MSGGLQQAELAENFRSMEGLDAPLTPRDFSHGDGGGFIAQGFVQPTRWDVESEHVQSHRR